MSIYRFELKKLFTKRTVIAVLAMFLILDGVKIASLNEKSTDLGGYDEGKARLIDELSGEITSEKLSFVIEKKNELEKLVAEKSYSTEPDETTYTGYQYGDYGIFKEAYDDLYYAYHYSESLYPIIEKAEKNLKLYPENSREYRFNRRVIALYGDRKITAYYNTEGYERYFSYDFSALLILLVIVFAVSPAFCCEKEFGMKGLLMSSPNGKNKTARAKLLSALTFSSAVTLVFSLFDFLCFYKIFDLRGFENPLYSVKGFAYTPLGVSVGAYIIISALLRLAGSALFCVAVLLLSKVFSRSVFSMLASLGFVMLNVALNDFVPESVKAFLPASLFVSRTYFKTADILQDVIPCVVVLLIFAVAVIAAEQKIKKDEW